LNRALDFTCQICNAVDHAHRQGVIHRDLRPANVLVTENDMLKVADFGTSRFLEIAAHGTTVIGSPPYMAPEQFQGKAVFASDIYSLGVTMYQMLTGTLPYDTPAPGDLDKLMSGELVSPPRLRNPAIPKAISDVVLRAMAPDVTARYQRATELLEQILAARAATQRRTPAASQASADGSVRGTRDGFSRGFASVKDQSRDSAGNAENRCTRGPTDVHSVVKRNNAIRGYKFAGTWILFFLQEDYVLPIENQYQ
jgi:serine/threonine protein kinase